MSFTLFPNVNQVIVGLGTYTYTIPTTGIYTVRLQQTETPPSEMAIIVKDDSTTVFTAPVIGQTQGGCQFTFTRSFTAAHVMTVVLTSSAASDNLLNSVKTSVSIGAGF